MHVVVVGCGRVGSGLAATLEQPGPHRGRHRPAGRGLPPPPARTSPASTIVGVGFDRDRLLDAGIERAGALAAVTNGDNSNILVARVARETFSASSGSWPASTTRAGPPSTSASASPPSPPCSWTTERVLRRLLPDAAGVEWIDPSAKVCLVERSIPDTVGRPPARRASRAPAVVRVAGAHPARRRADRRRPASLAQEGDVVWLAVAGDRIDELDRRAGGRSGAREATDARRHRRRRQRRHLHRQRAAQARPRGAASSRTTPTGSLGPWPTTSPRA